MRHFYYKVLRDIKDSEFIKYVYDTNRVFPFEYCEVAWTKKDGEWQEVITPITIDMYSNCLNQELRGDITPQ